MHLLKSKTLSKPISRYWGKGSDVIEKPQYNEAEQKVFINNDKYFEGINPEVWNYHIGGYQVLEKYLKDRKGRQMNDAATYCKIATAIFQTTGIQKEIDKIYPQTEKNLVEFKHE